MNAAEMRTAIALNGGKQMSGDLHEWTAKNVFNGELDRASSKSAATAWLYDSHSTVAVKYDKQLDTVYKKENLLNQYWIDGKIHTPYNRIIEADRHHALSYLMQSTFIDLFHRQIIKVDDALKNKKSFIAFFVHDELVLDVSKEDLSLIPELVNILEDTSYGKFCVNIKAGKTYGNLKKIDLGVR
jgi:hypothetical protein